MTIKTIANYGQLARRVDVECRLSNGLPQTIIIGLAGRQVAEAKDRLRSAFAASGLTWPRRRITINLLPSSISKRDPAIDLSIAVAVLIASDQSRSVVMPNLANTVFLGEVGLDGSVKPAEQLISKLSAIDDSSFTTVVLPRLQQNHALTVASSKLEIIGIGQLSEVLSLNNASQSLKTAAKPAASPNTIRQLTDMSEISGQAVAKRALEIAAAGGHNFMFIGPPGTGKTLLARSIIGLLPKLTNKQSLETSQIYEFYSGTENRLIDRPPLREPHPSISTTNLIGSSKLLTPGEISLAHNGVLLLNELPEFGKNSLESLRQPVEDHKIDLSFGKNMFTQPADFILAATANPCPCGFFGSKKLCNCAASDVKRHNSKLSGPMLERFDIFITLNLAKTQESIPNQPQPPNESSEVISGRVKDARKLQINRWDSLNSRVHDSKLKQSLNLCSAAGDLLDKATEKMHLSERGQNRTLRLARTIADLDNSQSIEIGHLAEALQLRPPKLLAERH